LLGRTGRMGHRGLATSFYTDRDEPIASVLTRTLMETKQNIPDFLESYKPEGKAAEHLKFEADSDFEEDNGNNADEGGGGWGSWGATGDSTDAVTNDSDTNGAATGAWGTSSGGAKKEDENCDTAGGW